MTMFTTKTLLVGFLLTFAIGGGLWWYTNRGGNPKANNHDSSTVRPDPVEQDEPSEEANHAGESARGLSSLLVPGPELHESLRTCQLELLSDLPTKTVPPDNPHLSTDAEFVEAISRGSSQGRIGRKGIRAALYGRYAVGDKDVGCYALEAESKQDADLREEAIREIWAYNTSLNRARVHRRGLFLAVLWCDGGVSPECWEAVNRNIQERLKQAQPS